VRREQEKDCEAQKLFAANLKRIRSEKRMTQEQVAEKADLHVNYISSVERGQRNLSISNIGRIAHALGVSMPLLLTEGASSLDSVSPAADEAPDVSSNPSS